MKVIATAKGYFGQVREVGDEFEVPDETGKSSWFTPVDEPIVEPVKQAKQGKGKQPEPESDADPI